MMAFGLTVPHGGASNGSEVDSSFTKNLNDIYFPKHVLVSAGAPQVPLCYFKRGLSVTPTRLP